MKGENTEEGGARKRKWGSRWMDRWRLKKKGSAIEQRR